MKKSLFSLLTVAFTLTYIQAQQMSYYVDMVGSPGQSFVIAQDDTINPGDFDLNIGTVGAGVIWNFQGLNIDFQTKLKTNETRLIIQYAQLVRASRLRR